MRLERFDDRKFCLWPRVLGETKYVQAASKAADFILDHMMAVMRLLHRWRDGQRGSGQLLRIMLFLFMVFWKLYEATFQDKYLDEAQTVGRWDD